MQLANLEPERFGTGLSRKRDDRHAALISLQPGSFNALDAMHVLGRYSTLILASLTGFLDFTAILHSESWRGTLKCEVVPVSD